MASDNSPLVENPVFGRRAPEASQNNVVESPTFPEKIYVPENKRGEKVWNVDSPYSEVYAPSFYQGGIEALTLLFDLPTQAVNWLLKKGSEAVGLDPKYLSAEKPLTLGDIVKYGLEVHTTIETAITD